LTEVEVGVDADGDTDGNFDGLLADALLLADLLALAVDFAEDEVGTLAAFVALRPLG
jgi:hypothetical protein